MEYCYRGFLTKFNFNKQIYFGMLRKWMVCLENGLHQGSLLSPMLFNIYFDDVLEKAQAELTNQILGERLRRRNSKRAQLLRKVKVFAYADDLAVFAAKKITRQVIDVYYKHLINAGFKINTKKTVYMAKKENTELKELGIERVKEFKYLGVWLSETGLLQPHYNKMKGIIMKNSYRIRALNDLLPIRFLSKLWLVYVRPYFSYVSSAMWTESLSTVKLWERLRRQSLRIVMKIAKGTPLDLLNQLFGYIEDSKDTERRQKVCQSIRIVNREMRRQPELNFNIFDQVEDTRKKRQAWFAACKIAKNNARDFNEDMDKYAAIKDKLKRKKWTYWNRYHVLVVKDMVWNSNRIRRIPNKMYFEQYKYMGMICDYHNRRGQRWQMTLRHMDQHVKNYPLQKNCEKMTAWILSEDNFNKHYQKSMNKLSRTCGDCIKEIIERCAEVLPLKKDKKLQEKMRQKAWRSAPSCFCKPLDVRHLAY